MTEAKLPLGVPESRGGDLWREGVGGGTVERGHLLGLLRGGLATWAGAARRCGRALAPGRPAWALVSTLRAAFALKCSLLALEMYQDFGGVSFGAS